MNKISERVFKNYIPDFRKLQKYGFILSDGAYSYVTRIMDDQFALHIRITGADVHAEVIDAATDEPYTLFLADDVCGSFVGGVKAAYEKVLRDIAERCFDKYVFKSEQARQLIGYVEETYGDRLEFLWEKFSDNAVWRRADNKKWYAVLLTVSKSKLGLPSDETVEILDVRADPKDIDTIVDNKKFFRGYHMNKKHWITVCLDGRVPLEEIQKMLDISCEIARKA